MENDRQNKAIKIKLIDNNIKLIKPKLKSGATTLKNSTISQLMTILEKLILKKNFLENGLILHQSDETAACHLHQRAQSGFELKTNISYYQTLFLESIIIVTGPSLSSETFISAPKMPVSMDFPKSNSN